MELKQPVCTHIVMATLRDFLEERLPEAEAVSAHVSGCQSCQEVLDGLTKPSDRLRTFVDDCDLAREAPLDSSGLKQLISRLGTELVVEAEVPLTFLEPPQQAGDVGTLGPYRILSVLGSGGMGVVVKGYDTKLKREVAIKALRPDFANDHQRARFEREGRAAAGLEDDHVAKVFTVDVTTGRWPYLVMEFVAGPTLHELLRRDKRLAPREAARMALEVAKGLSAVHHKGLIHRDIKPSNVILDQGTGRAKIVDFGLARSMTSATAITRDNQAPGTLPYMSPEQVRDPRQVDARSDVYGCGATLYEALTGEPPFCGTPEMVMHQLLEYDPIPPRRRDHRISHDLETICLKCLHKEPRLRYDGAPALAEDLSRFLEGRPIRARPLGVVGRSWR